MESISVAVIKETKAFPGVQLHEVNVTDYTGVEGFTFFTDYNNYPTATPCVLIHLSNDDLVSYPIDKLAFIAINEDSNETADREEQIAECKDYFSKRISDREFDPFSTSVFYDIGGYCPGLAIGDVLDIVDGFRQERIEQLKATVYNEEDM